MFVLLLRFYVFYNKKNFLGFYRAMHFSAIKRGLAIA